MALFRRTRSQREKVARQRCARESKVIKGRAREKVQEVKSAERLALKRLKSSCANNIREIRRTESGKERGTAARRKATIGTRRRRTTAKSNDFPFAHLGQGQRISGREYFHAKPPTAKERRRADFMKKLYNPRTTRRK